MTEWYRHNEWVSKWLISSTSQSHHLIVTIYDVIRYMLVTRIWSTKRLTLLEPDCDASYLRTKKIKFVAAITLLIFTIYFWFSLFLSIITGISMPPQVPPVLYWRTQPPLKVINIYIWDKNFTLSELI